MLLLKASASWFHYINHQDLWTLYINVSKRLKKWNTKDDIRNSEWKSLIKFSSICLSLLSENPKIIFRKTLTNFLSCIGFLLFILCVSILKVFSCDDNSYWSWQIRAGKIPVSVLIIIRYPLSVWPTKTFKR